MKRRNPCKILVIAVMIFAVAGFCREKPVPQKNVILIGWDGVSRSHIKAGLAAGWLPNLKTLVSQGKIVAIDVIRTTDTKSGWTQILTGYEPEITGVFSNVRYQPIPKGYTILERLKQYFGPDKFASVAVIGKKDHVDADGPERELLSEAERQPRKLRAAGVRIIEENGVKYLETPGKPYFIAKDGMDIFVNGLVANEAVATKAIELLKTYKDKPFFFFIHFAEVDRDGHQFGEDSKEYDAAIKSCDACLGRIIEALKAANLHDKTLIYVTADHGFDKGLKSHQDAPYVFLATNDSKIIRNGTRADIAPTIYDRLGVNTTGFNPPLSGQSLDRPLSVPLW